jgi:hypothetical protein
VSLYSIGYVKGYLGKRPVTNLVIFYSLFLAGMMMVVIADDALIFLISWEVMAAASYFLVMFEDENIENKAAFLYNCAHRSDRHTSFGISGAYRFKDFVAIPLTLCGLHSFPLTGQLPRFSGLFRVCRKGRHSSPTRLAAGGAPGCALECLRTDERRNA